MEIVNRNFLLESFHCQLAESEVNQVKSQAEQQVVFVWPDASWTNSSVSNEPIFKNLFKNRPSHWLGPDRPGSTLGFNASRRFARAPRTIVWSSRGSRLGQKRRPTVDIRP